MTTNGTPDSTITNPEGGAGGDAPFRQMEKARGVRQRRLERMVMKAKLKMARETAENAGEDVASCLKTLRAGLSAVDEDGNTDHRERRQASSVILQHHREVVKLAEPKAAAINIDARDQSQTVNTFDREGTLAALKDEKFRQEALDAPVVDVEAHERNGDGAE